MMIKIGAMDDASLRVEIRRIESSIETDPALAIGSSKELIVSVCKTTLDAKGSDAREERRPERAGKGDDQSSQYGSRRYSERRQRIGTREAYAPQSRRYGRRVGRVARYVIKGASNN